MSHDLIRYSDGPLSGETSPRQTNQQLRDVFREAFDILGGSEWLVRFASKNDSNARVFVQAISKLLPQQVQATVRSVKLDNLTDEDLNKLSIAELAKFCIDVDYEMVPPRNGKNWKFCNNVYWIK